MSVSEWGGIILQVCANGLVLLAAAVKLGARLAVIETKIAYIERRERETK